MVTEARIHTMLDNNWLRGKRQICGDRSLLLMTWQAIIVSTEYNTETNVSVNLNMTMAGGMSIAFQLRNNCESHCHKYGKDCSHSLLVIWGNRQDHSSSGNLKLSPRQHFSCKCIISMMVFIAEIVNSAITQITSLNSTILLGCEVSSDSICWFRTKSPDEILKMVP